eukprot:5007235-Pyramimonas_sp.AAC.1
MCIRDSTREASEAEPTHDDGRPSTIYDESEADLESHVIEVRHAELQGEGNYWRQLHQGASLPCPPRWFQIKVR